MYRRYHIHTTLCPAISPQVPKFSVEVDRLENEKLFGITINALLTVDGERKDPQNIYRKIQPTHLAALEPEELEVARF